MSGWAFDVECPECGAVVKMRYVGAGDNRHPRIGYHGWSNGCQNTAYTEEVESNT